MNAFNYKYTYFRGSKEYIKSQGQVIDSLLGQANTLLTDENNIKRALDFLDKVAVNEQQKELDSISGFIETQKAELIKYIPNFEKSEVYKKLKNPDAAIENIEQFYNEFIIALNSARRGIEETKRRLETIHRNINNTTRHFSNYFEDDYRFRLTSDIPSFIKRLTGQYSESDINDSSMSAKFQTMALSVMNQMQLAEHIGSGEDLVSIGSLILADLEHEAQGYLDKYSKQSGKHAATFEDLSEEIYEQIKNTYLQNIKNNSPQTKMQQLLLASLNDIENSILSVPTTNAKNILNLRSKVGQAKKIVNHSTKKDSKLEKELSAFHGMVSNNKKLNDSLYTITFSQGSSRGAHGDINELLESVISNVGTKVRGNVAVDLITYVFKYDIQRNPMLDEISHEMAERLSSIADYLSTSGRSDERDLTPILNSVNEDLRNTINNLDNGLKQLNSDDKIYITHETLKLSTRAERGFEFHGRSMSIFSYISYLCSANLSGFNVGDEQLLQFIAYNLVPGAVADDMIGPLEKYFSMFAGLLMFDDVQNMAIEAMSDISSVKSGKQVLQIHLYNLNGLYIPASMILRHVQEELGHIAELATSNLGAQAHIALSSNASMKESYTVRAAEARKTKVNITFLGGFVNLINNLFPGS